MPLYRTKRQEPQLPNIRPVIVRAAPATPVLHELNIPALQEALQSRSHEVVVLQSAAGNRPLYLLRPDKGRRRDLQSRTELEGATKRPAEPVDVVFVIGDGLSALAIEENATAFLDVMSPALSAGEWRIAPLVVVKEARVAIGDEVGEVLGAGMVVVLIGERPGLSSPDSMGIYMTLKPRIGLTDELRNCISNVRPEGLSYMHAAHKLLYLMNEARKRGISGVHLKEEAEALPQAVSASGKNFLIGTD